MLLFNYLSTALNKEEPFQITSKSISLILMNKLLLTCSVCPTWVHATRVNNSDTGLTAPSSHHIWKKILETDMGSLGSLQCLAGVIVTSCFHAAARGRWLITCWLCGINRSVCKALCEGLVICWAASPSTGRHFSEIIFSQLLFSRRKVCSLSDGSKNACKYFVYVLKYASSMCITFWSLLSTSEYFSRMSKPNSFAASMALLGMRCLWGRAILKRIQSCESITRFSQSTLNLNNKVWI